jgi:dihydropteroate synthase
MVNDVSGGLGDPGMPAVVAAAGVPYVAMHWRGHSADMQTRAVYDDVVAEVGAELRQRADALVAAGVAADRLVLDPGFGFAKLARHNWTLLAHLESVLALGHPVLVGTSRKAFLGSLTGDGIEATLIGTVAANLVAAAAGASIFRVHDVAEHVAALRIFHSMHGNITR